VNLRGKENVVARNLSYGDQRRLELARALATSPSLLLLDEPTAGMNPLEAASMVGLIRKIRDDFGTTVILIEHQMKVVMGVCERITVLDYGRTIAEGTPEQIQSNEQVIAAYLGTPTEDF
jgi:branched-chain amino acid transport system ATP-binding protein